MLLFVHKTWIQRLTIFILNSHQIHSTLTPHMLIVMRAHFNRADTHFFSPHSPLFIRNLFALFLLVEWMAAISDVAAKQMPLFFYDFANCWQGYRQQRWIVYSTISCMMYRAKLKHVTFKWNVNFDSCLNDSIKLTN